MVLTITVFGGLGVPGLTLLGGDVVAKVSTATDCMDNEDS